MTFCSESYYEEKITEEDFNKRISECDVKENSTPRKTDEYLEYRLYGLVPYNISPIQQGIQFGHALVEYTQMMIGIEPIQRKYNKFAQKDKTFIILNGGTTNENLENLGTLQQHAILLRNNEVLFAEFREPDLNNALTAIVFLVDERVFKKDVYPDFQDDENVSEIDNCRQYHEWVKKIGNEQNVFLREFLKQFKLA